VFQVAFALGGVAGVAKLLGSTNCFVRDGLIVQQQRSYRNAKISVRNHGGIPPTMRNLRCFESAFGHEKLPVSF
jgi:hypothetical protein